MAERYNLTSPKDIKELLGRHALKPRRHLGQNFLIDGNIVRKIIGTADIGVADNIIEVGPGAGALTASLLQSGANLLVIEIDNGLAAMLKDLFKDEKRFTIIEKDVLDIDWATLIAANFTAGQPVKLISNLPYVISAPFMYSLHRAGFPFASAVLMFQKEVAHRLVCPPGDSDYGSLSVINQYYTSGKMVFNVSNNVFWPRPKVGSAVVKLEPRSRELSSEEEVCFWDLVQGVFQQRRKTMLNNMIRLFPEKQRETLINLLARVSVGSLERPEALTVDQFAKLARITYNELK